MEIITDLEKNRNKIEASIKKFGYTPDHNFDWLIYCSDEGSPRVAMWNSGHSIWFYRNEENNEYIIVSNPVAPIEFQEKMIIELVNYFREKNESAKISCLDVRENIHNFVKDKYASGYKFDYEIIWPVFDVENWDPNLSGGHFKELRNALNKFNREHKVKIINTHDVSKENLQTIVNRWIDNRRKFGIELAFGRYQNMINHNFEGTKSSRVMMVDGIAVGFNAGWETPNNPSQWSASIGIHDFSVKDLGIALMYEDLVWIKNAGYKSCDLEGSDPEKVKFKTQFLKKWGEYKTYTFYLNI
jgi:hypothetical protein